MPGHKLPRGLQKLGEAVEAIEGSLPARAKTFEPVAPRGTRPAGCGHWLMESVASRAWSATFAGQKSLASRLDSEVAGETTGVDRDILDRLEAPHLNHLIRNALDHGLSRCLLSGGPDRQDSHDACTIHLEARHRAGMLQIILSDDGRGIDLERLRTKAQPSVELTTAGDGHPARVRRRVAGFPVPSWLLDQGAGD